MQVEAVLPLRSSAPRMMEISSVDSVPPRPSSMLWMATSALSWDLRNRACAPHALRSGAPGPCAGLGCPHAQELLVKTA